MQKYLTNGASLYERSEFIKMAQKVAHDIQSPLAALSVILNNCGELEEAKRLILKNAFNALKEIASNILTRYTENDHTEVQSEKRRVTLCSDFLLKVVSERKYQYQALPVRFEIDIAARAQFAFISVQPSQFGRAISNIISNAVDALKDIEYAALQIKLDAGEDTVSITVTDNGCGMPASMVERILSRTSYTSGKENGHGIGMMQVWDMVDSNQVSMSVGSQNGQGTQFLFTFARCEKAAWLADEIDVRYDDIILILDDDQLIHDAWDLRLKPLLQVSPDLLIRHEKNGEATIAYVASLSPEKKSRVHLLCDYQLINQDKDGLQVIEACQVDRKFLVTSYYQLADLQSEVLKLGIKMLPKQMALVAPMFCSQRYGRLKLNVDHIKYDSNFYNIEQRTGLYSQQNVYKFSPKSTPRFKTAGSA